eukprot:TRINITY_DN2344_c0_g1_i2.p3 TRINITY_DN2344_c0_g1~~TRINITY_DN2344_c0_g1_i2.p3  ORF type:complete len:237 (-),score=-18.99 TRINITY_DN2344_c0_g1_i2:1202-1912(-)
MYICIYIVNKYLNICSHNQILLFFGGILCTIFAFQRKIFEILQFSNILRKVFILLMFQKNYKRICCFLVSGLDRQQLYYSKFEMTTNIFLRIQFTILSPLIIATILQLSILIYAFIQLQLPTLVLYLHTVLFVLVIYIIFKKTLCQYANTHRSHFIFLVIELLNLFTNQFGFFSFYSKPSTIYSCVLCMYQRDSTVRNFPYLIAYFSLFFFNCFPEYLNLQHQQHIYFSFCQIVIF